MGLREQDYRFCISPDKTRGRWCNPVEIPHFYSDWSDHTDTPDEEFIKFLQSPIDGESE